MWHQRIPAVMFPSCQEHLKAARPCIRLSSRAVHLNYSECTGSLLGVPLGNDSGGMLRSEAAVPPAYAQKSGPCCPQRSLACSGHAPKAQVPACAAGQAWGSQQVCMGAYASTSRAQLICSPGKGRMYIQGDWEGRAHRSVHTSSKRGGWRVSRHASVRVGSRRVARPLAPPTMRLKL